MTAPLAKQTLLIKGIATPVISGGPDGDEAVLFVHGNPGSGQDWANLAAALAPFARVVAPDLPGYGRAAKPADFPSDVPSYVAHIDALLRELRIERVHLVLHDLGGAWGLAWAAANTQRVASLTLINTGVLLDYRWHFAARIWQLPLIGELFQAMTTRGAFHRALQQAGPRQLPRDFIDRMYRDYDAGTRRAVLRTYRSMKNPTALIAPLLASVRAVAPTLPVLVVWGRRDPYIPDVYAQRQREIFPAAEIVMLDDSGHWPFADDPAAVEAVVVPFLRRVVAGRSNA